VSKGIFTALAAFGFGYVAVKAVQGALEKPPARGAFLPPQRPLPSLPFMPSAVIPVTMPSVPSGLKIRQPISFVRDSPPPVQSPALSRVAANFPTWKKLPAVFALKKGGQYLATLKLSGLERTFATEDIIADRFRSAGFSNVKAFTSSSPQGAPLEASSGPWVRGQWSGNEGEIAQLPPQVADVWILQEENIA
jgi:hypothetical protein